MASSTTRADILALAYSSQGFVPEAEEQRPSNFLSLAPTTSASYPSNPALKVSSSVTQSSAQAPVAPVTSEFPAAAEDTPVIPADAIDVKLKTRRSSSLSSDGSGSVQKKRFLKLGPVHHGEGTGDWSEDVVAE